MRAVIFALCLLYASTAHAQEGKYATTPVADCPEVANQYINYGIMVRVYLLLRPDCTYEIQARGRVGVGIATRTDDGTLILPFKYSEKHANERIELRRNWLNLNGYAMIDGETHAISFYIKKWR